MQPIIKGNDSSYPSTLNIADGGNPIFLYRYFMMKIVEAYRDVRNSLKLQFSRVQFIDKNGTPFIYPTNPSETHSTNIIEIFSGEGLLKAIENDTSTTPPKACFEYNQVLSESNPIKIVYDLNSKCLNLLTFSRWHWYTAGDTEDWGRNIKAIRLLVSNVGNINDDSCWKEIDYVSGLEDIKKNYALAYERKTPFELY